MNMHHPAIKVEAAPAVRGEALTFTAVRSK